MRDAPQYDKADGYERLGAALYGWEAAMSVGTPCSPRAVQGTAPGGPVGPRLGRLFYLALPPSAYPQVRVGHTAQRKMCFPTCFEGKISRGGKEEEGRAELSSNFVRCVADAARDADSLSLL